MRTLPCGLAQFPRELRGLVLGRWQPKNNGTSLEPVGEMNAILISMTIGESPWNPTVLQKICLHRSSQNTDALDHFFCDSQTFSKVSKFVTYFCSENKVGVELR